MKIQSGRHQGRSIDEEVGGAVWYIYCAGKMDRTLFEKIQATYFENVFVYRMSGNSGS